MYQIPSKSALLLCDKTNVYKHNEQLQHWLCRFVHEVRKVDGQHYPHVNVNHIIRGVMHFLQQSGRQMDLYQDPSFQEFRTVLDSKMKGLKVLAWGLRLSHLLNRKKSSCGRKESLEKALHRRCPMQYFSAMASTLSILPNHGRGKVWRATISPICRRCFQRTTKED